MAYNDNIYDEDPSLPQDQDSNPDTIDPNENAARPSAIPSTPSTSLQDLLKIAAQRYSNATTPATSNPNASPGEIANRLASGGAPDYNAVSNLVTPQKMSHSDILMDLGLRMMAAGSKPGSTVLGSLGEAGIGVREEMKGRDKSIQDAHKALFGEAQGQNKATNDMLKEIMTGSYQSGELGIRQQNANSETKKINAMLPYYESETARNNALADRDKFNKNNPENQVLAAAQKLLTDPVSSFQIKNDLKKSSGKEPTPDEVNAEAVRRAKSLIDMSHGTSGDGANDPIVPIAPTSSRESTTPQYAPISDFTKLNPQDQFNALVRAGADPMKTAAKLGLIDPTSVINSLSASPQMSPAPNTLSGVSNGMQ